MTETTIPDTAKRWPVPGIKVGQIVTGRAGRRMRVTDTNEWVCMNGQATGPYCALQALDDKSCRVIWPRAWFNLPGETIQLEFGVFT